MMNGKTRRILLTASLFASLSVGFLGCGYDNPLGRIPVSGEVLVDGEPLARGFVNFVPADGQTQTRTGAVITEGRYTLPLEKGLPPGKYVVQIRAVGEGLASDSDAPPGTQRAGWPMRQPIPPKYNDRSELTREVAADGPCAFDFDIKTK